MRVFFAIEFEEEIKEYLFSIREEIKQHCMAGNFTFKENFHLTLRFIGEQSQNQVETLKSALKEATIVYPFELKLDKIGSFTKGNRKIIWVGLQKNKELGALYSHLENVLVRHGYAKEARGFNPHITLAREVKMDDYEELVNKLQVETLAIKVKSISLMESKRIDNKLCYVPIEKVVFAND